jgi:hypothetical protein
MPNKLLLTSSLMAILAGCGLHENESTSSAAASSGGGGGTPMPGPGPAPGPIEPGDVDQYPYSYNADCDGDGVDDCVITEIRFGPIGGFATQIKYTHPVTQLPVVEVICNGDYNGEDPEDPSDDEPCNAPACSDESPRPPPKVNFPPDPDGPCAAYNDATGEVCSGTGDPPIYTCDCVFPDPSTETGLSPTYPDDTDGDGVNDCPP